MHRLTLFLCCLFLFGKGYAAIDLERILKKIDTFNVSGETDSSAVYFPVLQKELKQHPTPLLQIAYYDRQINYLRQIGQFDKSMAARDSLLKALPQADPQNSVDSFSVARAYSNAAGSAVDQFKYKEAIELQEKALNFVKFMKDERYRAYFLQNMGLCYIKLAQVEKGLAYTNKAFAIYDRTKDYEGKFGCADYIGTTMTDYKNYPLAWKYFQIALATLDSLNNPNLPIGVYNNIGRMYNYEEKYDSSRVYFEKALDAAGKLGADYWISLAKCNLGEVLMKMGHYGKAEAAVSDALQIFRQLNFGLGDFQTTSLLAYICVKTKRFSLSEKYQQEAENLLKNTEVVPNLLIDFYKRSYEIEKELHRYEKSLSYLEKYGQLQDSINNELLTWKVNELESKLFTSVKERQLSEKEKELLKTKNEKYTIIVSSGTTLSVLLALFLFVAYKKRKEKQLFSARQDLMAREHEKGTLQLQLMLIRNRLSPHLISNLFLDLKQLIETDDREKALDLLNPVSRLVLYSYTHTDSLTVPLKQELTFVKNYIEVRKPALGSRFSYQIGFPDQAGDRTVPSMIVQLFVENAIKHGLLKKEGDRELYVGTTADERLTNIEIRDNGIGRKNAKDLGTSGTGMGFFLMEKLTDHLNTQNKEPIQWQVDDLYDKEGKAAGTRIRIGIPKNYTYQLL